MQTITLLPRQYVFYTSFQTTTVFYFNSGKLFFNFSKFLPKQQLYCIFSESTFIFYLYFILLLFLIFPQRTAVFLFFFGKYLVFISPKTKSIFNWSRDNSRCFPTKERWLKFILENVCFLFLPGETTSVAQEVWIFEWNCYFSK